MSAVHATHHKEVARDAAVDRLHNCGSMISHLILDMGIGGAEKLVHDITISLRRKGLKTNVICMDAITRNTEPLERNDVPIELIKRTQTAFDPVACGRVIRRLKALGTTLIHAHDLTSLAYAVPAGLALRLPVVMTEHSRHYIEERLIRRLEKRLLCLGVSALVDVSPVLAKASVERDSIPARKVTVIENGVDLERFSGADRQKLRRELGVDPGDILVGMVARLEEIKGPAVLLEAFGRLAGEHARARLVFVGDGSLEEALKERARALGVEGRTHFLGARTDIPDVMVGLDIQVLPSLSEGLPFALLEGMAAGLAITASAVGAIPGIFQEEGGENGVLVPPGDPQALAEALSGLIGDESRRARLGRAARNYVERRYDLRAMLKRYEDVYARALSKGGAA